MTFTEKDLRAMLEDNSSNPPPADDLTATVQARGRRVRRRRQAAGTIAAAALVALGFTVVPSLGADDSPGTEVLASTSATSPAARPDVDLSLLKKLKKDSVAFAFTTSMGVETASPEESGEPSLLLGTLEERGVDYAMTTKPRGNSIIGTVEGFSLNPDAFPKMFGGANKKQQHGIRMKIRLGAQLDDSAEFQKRGLREGETVDVHVGYTAPGSDPTDVLAQAVPKGTRVLAFEANPLWLSGISGPEETRNALSVILEDADGTLTGGSYTRADPDQAPSPWQKAKSFDELLELVPSLKYECPPVGVYSRGEVDEESVRESLTDSGAERPVTCASINFPSDGWPKPGDPPAVPTPSPTSPGEDRPAEPAPPGVPGEDRPAEPAPAPPGEEPPAEPAPAPPGDPAVVPTPSPTLS